MPFPRTAQEPAAHPVQAADLKPGMALQDFQVMNKPTVVREVELDPVGAVILRLSAGVGDAYTITVTGSSEFQVLDESVPV